MATVSWLVFVFGFFTYRAKNKSEMTVVSWHVVIYKTKNESEMTMVSLIHGRKNKYGMTMVVSWLDLIYTTKNKSVMRMVS